MMDEASQSGRTSGSGAESTHLATAECWALLQHASLGRLAVLDSAGRPDVYPINFTSHEGAVYLRTARDTKLARITARPAAALEVDGEDDSSRWSVVVRGDALHVRDEREIRDSGVLQVESASPAFKPFVIKLSPRSVTGRRYLKAEAAGGTGRFVTDAKGPQNDAVAGSARTPDSRRPDPIPHHPPLSLGGRGPRGTGAGGADDDPERP